jgi:hypothetical protein
MILIKKPDDKNGILDFLINELKEKNDRHRRRVFVTGPTGS